MVASGWHRRSGPPPSTASKNVARRGRTRGRRWRLRAPVRPRIRGPRPSPSVRACVIRIGAVAYVETGQRDPDALRRSPSFGVEDVGRDRRSGRRRPPLSSGHGRSRSEVGDLHFSARWEEDAPGTTEAIRRMLPLALPADPLPLERRVDLDPVRRLRPDIGFENHSRTRAGGRSRSTRAASASARSCSVRRLHDFLARSASWPATLRDDIRRGWEDSCARWAGAAVEGGAGDRQRGGDPE